MEEVKLSLYADDMILYIENPKDTQTTGTDSVQQGIHPLFPVAESGEDAQKWHLTKGRKRRKNRSSASALRWLEEKMYLVCAASLHPWTTLLCLRSFWQGNHLPSNWWDAGEGWLRWVLCICFHVGCPGCSPEMQELGLTALHIKSGPQDETGPRLLDQGPSQRSEPSPAQGWRLGRLRMSPPSPPTAPAGRGIAVVPISEQNSSNYCFLLINCFDVKIKKLSKAAGYKINIQKLAAFLYTNNEIPEKEYKQ